MTLRTPEDFLDRMKLSLLEAEVLHHVQRGDLTLQSLPDHLESHGLDATEDDVSRAITRLVEEDCLENRDERLIPTDRGYDRWQNAARIVAHFGHELREGVQAVKSVNYPGGR